MGTCSCQCHSPWASVIPPCCICECKNKLNPSMGSYWMPDNSIEDRINHTQDGIEKCFNRIEKIEGDLNHVPSFEYIDEKLKKLENKIEAIGDISDAINRMIELAQDTDEKKPYVCPLCKGEGTPIHYAMTCTVCDDKGIVWG